MNAIADKPADSTSIALIPDGLSIRVKRLVNLYVAGMAAFRTAKAIRGKVREWTQYTVTVMGSDPMHDELSEWITRQLPTKRRRAVRARLVDSRDTTDEMSPVSFSSASKRTAAPPPRIATEFDGERQQTIMIGGHKIQVMTISREPPGTDLGGRADAYIRSTRKIVLTAQTIAGRDAIIAHLNTLAAARAERPPEPQLAISARWGGWTFARHTPRRTLDSVVLAAGQKERIVADLERFLAAEADYAHLSLPWHRGYLLYGPPGTGKTSTALALGTHFGLDLYYLSLGDIQDDDTLMRMLVEMSPVRSMLVIEDVDIVHASRDRESEAQGVTMQGLLNALDGMVTPHGLITVMTTNRREVLDEALVRAGRVDLEEHVQPLDAAATAELVRVFTGVAIVIPDGSEFFPNMIVEIVKHHVHDPAAAIPEILDYVGGSRDPFVSQRVRH